MRPTSLANRGLAEIEIRVAAEMSKDDQLLAAFHEDRPPRQKPYQEPLSCTLCGTNGDVGDLDYCERCCEMICRECFHSPLHSCLLDEVV